MVERGLAGAAEGLHPQPRERVTSAGPRARARKVRVLQRELPGYAEYAARVRWKLVPGVW